MRRHRIIKKCYDAGWQADGSFQPDGGFRGDGLTDDQLLPAIEYALSSEFYWVEVAVFHWQGYAKPISPTTPSDAIAVEVWVETYDNGVIKSSD